MLNALLFLVPDYHMMDMNIISLVTISLLMVSKVYTRVNGWMDIFAMKFIRTDSSYNFHQKTLRRPCTQYTTIELTMHMGITTLITIALHMGRASSWEEQGQQQYGKKFRSP